jgi:hypothetical protein
MVQHYANWSKSDIKGQMLQDSIYMKYLEKSHS